MCVRDLKIIFFTYARRWRVSTTGYRDSLTRPVLFSISVPQKATPPQDLFVMSQFVTQRVSSAMSNTINSAAAPANRQDVDVVLQRRISLPQSGKDVIVIQLNRPERLNCFDTNLCYRLAQVVRDVVKQLERMTSTQQLSGDNDESSIVCAVILTSSGTSFCAGADLTDPPNPLEQSMDLPECLERNPAYQISRIPVPVIGALQGYVSEEEICN